MNKRHSMIEKNFKRQSAYEQQQQQQKDRDSMIALHCSARAIQNLIRKKSIENKKQ